MEETFMRIRLFLAGVLALVLAAASGTRAAETITAVQRYTFEAPNSAATQLSGITFLGGKSFLSVGDQGQLMHRLKIDVDRGTGEIGSFAIGKSVQLRYPNGIALTGGDFEGIAAAPPRGSVFIVNEADSTIREFGMGGKQRHGVTPADEPQMAVFANKISNQGLESMARSPRGGFVWTANQNTLVGDGLLSTLTNGETVRVQRLTSKLKGAGQWTYRLDANDAQTGWTMLVNNNISDMLALPDGNLVVLERALGRSGSSANQSRIRLYKIGFGGATRVDGGSIDGATPVAKTLLWETIEPDLDAKFEGLTLGPRLNNGDYSILMLADNSGGSSHSLYALRVSGIGKYADPTKATGTVASALSIESVRGSSAAVPEPGIAGVLIAFGALGMRRRRI
jgi:hypothetical protein